MVTMRFQYAFQATGSGPQRCVYVVPFISQPRTSTVSGMPSRTRRSASLRKCSSYDPFTPARSRRRTSLSETRASLRSIMGVLRTNILFASARRHAAQ